MMTTRYVTRRVSLLNKNGLHLRAAALLAQTAAHFHSDVRVTCRNRVADAKSVLELLSLVAEPGSELDLEARGPDSWMTINAMADLILNGFSNSLERSRT